MSLAANGLHYTRNGLDGERLFDLTEDPFELDNLMQRPDAGKRVEAFRNRLLRFLNENPASAEVEKAYLKGFRERLRAAVSGALPKSQHLSEQLTARVIPIRIKCHAEFSGITGLFRPRSATAGDLVHRGRGGLLDDNRPCSDQGYQSMVQSPQSEEQCVLTIGSSVVRIKESSLKFSGDLLADDA